MYWGYFALFVLAIVTPTLIDRPYFSFSEPTVEGLLIMLYGVISFSLSVAKEKQILRYVREKLNLEREKHDITKDLSDSYSYIGEANRKIDVLQSLVSKFPDMINTFRDGGGKRLYQAIENECRIFSKSDSFVLRIVDVETHVVKKEICEGKVACIDRVPTEKLMTMECSMIEEGGCTVVRSSENGRPYAAYLIFPKRGNYHVENVEILKALTAQVLAFFMLEDARAKGYHYRQYPKEHHKEHHEETNRH